MRVRRTLQRWSRFADELAIVQLGSLESGWRVPIDRCGDWRTAYVLGAGEDPSFPLALLRRAPSMTVHVFDRALDRSGSGRAETEAVSASLLLHPWSLVGRGDATPGESLGDSLSRSGFAHLDVLAIHDSEPVADIVGAVLDHGLEVRLLCLAIGGTPHRDLLSGVVGEMKAAGYRMVHASAGSRAWRVSFEARA